MHRFFIHLKSSNEERISLLHAVLGKFMKIKTKLSLDSNMLEKVISACQ